MLKKRKKENEKKRIERINCENGNITKKLKIENQKWPKSSSIKELAKFFLYF